MYGQIKVGKCRLRVWWYIFLAQQIALIILMIGTFGSSVWVQTNMNFYANKNDYTFSDSTFNYQYSGSFDGKDFKGSISSCKEGCEFTYISEATDWCEIYNDFYDKGMEKDKNDEKYNEAKSLCLMFYSLYAASSSFFVFEISSMVAILFWLSTMMCFLRRINCFWMTYCCSVCGCVCHYIGILLWFGFTRSSFGDKCGKFPKDGTLPEICARDGPGLAVFVMILFPIVTIFYIVIACIAYPKRNNPEYHHIEPSMIQISQIGVSQVVYPQSYQPSALIIHPPPGQYPNPMPQGPLVNDVNYNYNNNSKPVNLDDSAGYPSSAYLPQAYPPVNNPNPQELTNPPSSYPPSSYPPSSYPPSSYPPSAYPPSAYPPSAYPPSAYPPSAYPPNAYPPNAYPPNANPSNDYPPNAYPPNAYPPSDPRLENPNHMKK